MAPGPSAPPPYCTAADTQTARRWSLARRRGDFRRRVSGPQILLWCAPVPIWGGGENYVMRAGGENGERKGDLAVTSFSRKQTSFLSRDYTSASQKHRGGCLCYVYARQHWDTSRWNLKRTYTEWKISDSEKRVGKRCAIHPSKSTLLSSRSCRCGELVASFPSHSQILPHSRGNNRHIVFSLITR